MEEAIRKKNIINEKILWTISNCNSPGKNNENKLEIKFFKIKFIKGERENAIQLKNKCDESDV